MDTASSESKNAVPEFDAIVGEHRALAILRLLQRQGDYRANLPVISDWLDCLALGSTLAVVRADISRLEGLLVVTANDPVGTLIVELKQRGLDYLEGREAIEGLPRRPLSLEY